MYDIQLLGAASVGLALHILFPGTGAVLAQSSPSPHRIFEKFSKSGHPPCVPSVGVTGLMHPVMMIEVEVKEVFD